MAKKQLVIKNFKVKPRLPPDFEERSWSKLALSLDEIHAGKPRISHSWEELYQICETWCRHRLAPQLYQRLCRTLETHIQALQRELVAVQTLWSNHCRDMMLIRGVFLYLDRTYVLQTKGIASIWDVGLSLIRTHWLEHAEIQPSLLSGLLAEIQQERMTQGTSPADRSLLQSLLRMYTDLGVYNLRFEYDFLRSTEQFYRQESTEWIRTLSTADYLRHVDRRLREEVERVEQYLDASTKPPLVKIVEKELIAVHAQYLLEHGFDALMEQHQLDTLQLLFRLLARVDALEQVRLFFGHFIKKTGSVMVLDEQRDAHLVADLLAFKQRLDQVLHTAFVSPTHPEWHEKFGNTLKESFESFLNRRPNKPAELIAQFLDQKLKSSGSSGGGGGGGMAASTSEGVGIGVAREENVESTLDQLLVLFRFLQGKDVFEAFYKRDLAKRLLLGRSASVDLEKSMLGKLRAECGPQFTSKLEGMFRDMELSKDIMNAFKESKWNSTNGTKLEFSAHVLTQGFWPNYPVLPVRMPDAMLHHQQAFESFYHAKYHGRRLLWQHSLGQCTLKGNFAAGPRELLVSQFQALVLLCFNEVPGGGDTLSYEEIQERVGLEESELKRVLQSLACGKVRVLVKHPKGKEVSVEDQFTYHSEFTSKLRRIRINQIQTRPTTQEQSRTTEEVFVNRQYQVDAAIVRILKARKRIKHAQLMAEVMEMCKFPMTGRDLKDRIESLLHREYLERVDDEETGFSGYQYLA